MIPESGFRFPDKIMRQQGNQHDPGKWLPLSGQDHAAVIISSRICLADLPQDPVSGISEAVLLGSRIAVMTPGPARLAEMIEIRLPYPRRLDMKTSEEFGAYSRRIYALLGME